MILALTNSKGGVGKSTCEATSIAGFVQQLAAGYVANGYWFSVTGINPSATVRRCPSRLAGGPARA